MPAWDENAAAMAHVQPSVSSQIAPVRFGGKTCGHFDQTDRMRAAVFPTSMDDGGHEGYRTNFPAYTPPQGPGLWVPTAPGQGALQPYWGTTVQTFALSSAAECDPGGPPADSETPASEFY